MIDSTYYLSAIDDLMEAGIVDTRLIAACIQHHALTRIAKELNALGLKDSSTNLGALELVAKEIKGAAEALERV